LSIAVGSSLQIALFITPVLIFASYLFGLRMTLEFSLPEVAGLSLAVGIVVLISGDGECNWFEGAQLLAVYLIIAVLFSFQHGRGKRLSPNAQCPQGLWNSAMTTATTDR
jgi:Ca2+:H+ antiporter